MAFARCAASLYLPEMNCEKHAKRSLEKAAKESECGPLHSPFNCQPRGQLGQASRQASRQAVEA